MSKMSKLALIVAIATGVAAPALAQYRDDGQNAFGMVPPNSTSADPALTGGGSTGYNADIPHKTD